MILKNTKFFEEHKLEFFGLQHRSERPKKVLIKGIPKDFKIEDIKSELVKLNFPFIVLHN